MNSGYLTLLGDIVPPGSVQHLSTRNLCSCYFLLKASPFYKEDQENWSRQPRGKFITCNATPEPSLGGSQQCACRISEGAVLFLSNTPNCYPDGLVKLVFRIPSKRQSSTKAFFCKCLLSHRADLGANRLSQRTRFLVPLYTV